MAAQAGAPLHFELYTEEDDVNYIRWKWISKKEAHRVLRGIDGRLLRRSGLHDALWMDWARPEEGVRVRFCYIGRLEPPLSARHYDELLDWVPERSRTAKTWYANDVYLPVWRPIIQLINVVLLGKQKPLEVTGAFLYILKNKVGPADEDENLDWATYFKEKVREEIRACKKQMQASGKRKVRPTCIGIVVLHILRTCGIVDDEDIVLSDSDKSVEEVTPPRSTRAAPVHVQSSSSSPDRVGSPSNPDRGEPADNELVTGFGSPMVPYPASEDDEEGAIEGAIKGLTSLGAADLTTIAKGKRPVLHKSSSESEEIRFARPDRVKRRVAATEDEAGGPVSQQAEIAHSWSQENCTAYQTAREQHKDGFLRCKSVQVLYDFGICTKDVIIIDDSVQKNSPNHPFQAVHPRPFDPFQTAKKDENYLTKVLQPFLDKFRGHRGTAYHTLRRTGTRPKLKIRSHVLQTIGPQWMSGTRTFCGATAQRRTAINSWLSCTDAAYNERTRKPCSLLWQERISHHRLRMGLAPPIAARPQRQK
ncbi:hypothetical protein R1sor_009693 [Riccia sorocarpa]|uniref:FCP1 homology domain-containing protein n=1 Tax=Riccia sorocarpa TaxID=122646 RepID=A0ABD3HYL2_9MARC